MSDNMEPLILFRVCSSVEIIWPLTFSWIYSGKDLYSLKYDVYDDELKLNNEESKRFESLSDYSSNLLFESLPYELPLMEKDSVLKKYRERWHETLKQDIYIDEALNVLKDLIMNFNGYDISILEN